MDLPRMSLFGDADAGTTLLFGTGAIAVDAPEGSLPTGGIQ